MESKEIQQHEIAEIEEFADKRDSMLGEIRKVIVGQDDVVEGVLFLESSPYITGEILHVDGGQIAGHSEPFG